ncbi:MAG: lipocalin family protein [Bacteroidales bacterium]|nr:lipocalin family protein [Bacteroidales bacterium]
MKTFKTFVAIALAALTLSLTGCKKDNEDLILGTWTLDSASATYTMEGQTRTESMSPEDATETLTFKKDGTLTQNVKYDDGEEEVSDGKWSMKDDKLTIEYEDSETQMMPRMTFNIEKLDKKNLKLLYKGNLMGTNMEIKMIFKK